MSGDVSTVNSVTEGGVTYTANDTVENIRHQVGLSETEAKPSTAVSDDEADEQPVDLKAEPKADDRDPHTGKFVAKPKDDKGGDPRTSIQAKINEERRLRGEAERKAEAAERRAAEIEARLAIQTPKPATPAAPEPAALPTAKPTVAERLAKPLNYAPIATDTDFWLEYPDASVADMTRYFARYESQSILAERDQTAAQTQQDEAARSVVRDMHADAAAKYPDWDTLVTSPAADVVLPDVVLNELFEDPSISADLWHHLLSHPDEMQAMAQVTEPIAAARAIAKLTVGLSTAHSGPEIAPRQTKAKPLIKPVGASPAAPEASPPDALPFGKKYIDAMNELERKQRKA